MSDLTAVIVGARPKSRGYNMGDFHARELHNAGVEITGISNNSLDSSALAASDLKNEFEINARPYSSLEEMLKLAKPDIVVVSTPPETHYKISMLALNAGCHVLAEKPLCWDLSKSPKRNFNDAKYLLRIAERKGKMIAANHQLAALCDIYMGIFNDYGEDRNPGSNDNFELRLITSGVPNQENNKLYVAMDLLPHALSLLIKLFPGGHISSAVESSSTEGENTLKFMFGNGFGSVPSKLTIGYNSSAAELSFGLNGFIVTKQIERRDAKGVFYSLVYNNKALASAGDPLREFDNRFVAAVANNDPKMLLVSPGQLVGITHAQYQIMQHLTQQIN